MQFLLEKACASCRKILAQELCRSLAAYIRFMTKTRTRRKSREEGTHIQQARNNSHQIHEWFVANTAIHAGMQVVRGSQNLGSSRRKGQQGRTGTRDARTSTSKHRRPRSPYVKHGVSSPSHFELLFMISVVPANQSLFSLIV